MNQLTPDTDLFGSPITDHFIKKTNSLTADLIPTAARRTTAMCHVPLCSIKLVKEQGTQYAAPKSINGPSDAYNLIKQYYDLVSPDREHLLVVCVDAHNKPLLINGGSDW